MAEEEEEQEKSDKKPGEEEEEEELTPFQEKFKEYAAFGDPKNKGEYITLANIDKWFKKANVKKISLPEAAEAFKTVAKNKFALTEEEFDEFLKTVTEGTGLTPDEVKELLLTAETPEDKKSPGDEIPRLDHCAPGAIPVACADTASNGKRTPTRKLEPCRPPSTASKKDKDPCKSPSTEPAMAMEQVPCSQPTSPTSDQAKKISPCDADCPMEQAKALPPCSALNQTKTCDQSKKSKKK